MTFTVGWLQRAVGLAVLGACVGVVLVLGLDLPWPTWLALGVFGFAALVSSVSNFGDRLHADAEGLRRENVLLRRLGLGSERVAAWTDVLSAMELDGRTIFLTVQGQPRWVLDSLQDHEELRRLLEERGIAVQVRARPRLRDFGRGPRDVPPS